MSEPAANDVTAILAAASAGDASASDRLFPLIYDQLRAQAAQFLQAENPGHTLQPTALVHEAYLKLVGQRDASYKDRGHFFAVAAMAMRRILVNHAKSRKRIKRGGGVGVKAAEAEVGRPQRVPLDDLAVQFEERAVDLVALDEGMERLRSLNEDQARVVDLRFFAGLTVEQIAEVLGISQRTVHRDWSMAKAWLRGEIERGVEGRERDAE